MPATNYSLTTLSPFGLMVQAEASDQSVEQFTELVINLWLETHKLIVFRSFKQLSKQQFALYGQRLGEPVQWAFGAINELIVKPDAENYIYTNNEVPMHWDGAFIEKQPHIIAFQCIQGPPENCGGGSTFCNTEALLKAIPDAKTARFDTIYVKYKTDKLAHYGGEIVQKLIKSHEVYGTRTLRYAEPVDDINPVSVTFLNKTLEEERELHSELKSLLYDPRFLYTHHWEDGDFVFADNHSLLHGREAFLGSDERHIQRINILPRPKMTSFLRSIKNSITIRRKEFFAAEIPIVLIPVLLTVPNLTHLFSVPVLLGFLALFLLFNVGDMMNCYSDYKLDAIYKSHLSNAVFELGKKNVLIQIIVSAVLAMGLTTYIAILTEKIYLIPVAILGLLAGLQYSTFPFKFKSMGNWQFIGLWAIIFFGPMLFASLIAIGTPALPYLLFYSLFGIHQTSIIIMNTAEDYLEDLNDGVRTVIVQTGLHKSLKFAWFSIFMSGIGIQLYLIHEFEQIPNTSFAYILSALIFTLSWCTILYEFRAILVQVKGKTDLETTNILKKNGMKVPRWLKIGAYSCLSVIVFIVLLKHKLL